MSEKYTIFNDARVREAALAHHVDHLNHLLLSEQAKRLKLMQQLEKQKALTAKLKNEVLRLKGGSLSDRKENKSVSFYIQSGVFNPEKLATKHARVSSSRNERTERLSIS